MTQPPAPPAVPNAPQPAQPSAIPVPWEVRAPAAGTTQPAVFPALPPLPNEYVVLATLLILVTLLPLSIALARRVWRRAANTPNTDLRLDDRLADMQGAIESMALEVERIGEGQRFVTGLLSERAKGAPLESLRQLPEVGQKQDFRSITPH